MIEVVQADAIDRSPVTTSVRTYEWWPLRPKGGQSEISDGATIIVNF
jgi:hypothetical protein